ncbi:hypothetical protein EIP91_012109 [Steccherinum ochraceum]|uniref:Uncharacterized protein n=1 Tax=Steccherinum ochraceum TaxID=92696 RepID=A0A4R0RQV4_9APHY|nr:hypothetical protein EIP91_012109 [Steccherinum ochraceum]
MPHHSDRALQPCQMHMCDSKLRDHGKFKHYGDKHNIALVTFKEFRHSPSKDNDQIKPREYHMFVPRTPTDDRRSESYMCPACSARRPDYLRLRYHTANECKSYLKKSAQCPKCAKKYRNKWLHNQLVHETKLIVNYANSKGVRLTRDEGQDFECLGCDFASPFTGALQMHALRCTLPRHQTLVPIKPELGEVHLMAPPTPLSTFRPLSKQKRKYAQIEGHFTSDEDDEEYVESPTKRRARTSVPCPSKVHAAPLPPTQSVIARCVPPSKFQSRPITPPITPSARRPFKSSVRDPSGYHRARSAPLRIGPPNTPRNCQSSPKNQLVARHDNLSLARMSRTTQGVERSKTAQPEVIPLRLPLHKSGFPSSKVHAFVEEIPISDRLLKEVFNALGTAGVKTLEDVADLVYLLQDRPEYVQNFFRGNGDDPAPVGFMAWIVLRFELLSRTVEDVNAFADDIDSDSQMATKVTKLRDESPLYMSPFAAILCKLGFMPAEVLLLFDLSSDEREELHHYLADSELLSFKQLLSFKRALRLTTNEDSSSGPFTSPVSRTSLSQPLEVFLGRLPGSPDIKFKALTTIGIETLDELDELCASPEEDIEEIVNLMIDDGLRFPELGVVLEGLRARGATLSF